jgi:hypothetical protein
MWTAKLVASVVGRVSDPAGWAGPVALATVPVIPAVALAEVEGGPLSEEQQVWYAAESDRLAG